MNVKQIIRNQQGLTLVEILIAVTLIAIVGTLAFTNLNARLEEGKVKTTRAKIKQIEQSVMEYKLRCGAYPPSLNALKTPEGDCPDYPTGGFVSGSDDFKRDTWNSEFVYTVEGDQYTITSLGSDRREGGEGTAKDIISSEM